MGSDMVNILVGEAPDKQSFSMHKDLLTVHSGYFRDWFTNNFYETSVCDSTISLPFISPAQFALFNTWLYLGELKTGQAIWNRWMNTDYYEVAVWSYGSLDIFSKLLHFQTTTCSIFEGGTDQATGQRLEFLMPHIESPRRGRC